MQPETTLNKPTHSRSLGISLGVTEVIYLLGLICLAAGISLAVGIEWALIAVGLFMIRTAESNARERKQG